VSARQYALLADIVITSETAEFSGLAEAAAALTGSPPLNGPRLVERSAYYALASSPVTAEDARRCDVVAETHPAPQVPPRARELAETLAARPELISTYLRDVIRQDAGTASAGSTRSAQPSGGWRSSTPNTRPAEAKLPSASRYGVQLSRAGVTWSSCVIARGLWLAKYTTASARLG
jgi:enoyl-CoA hydratase/carnithine racemase